MNETGQIETSTGNSSEISSTVKRKPRFLRLMIFMSILAIVYYIVARIWGPGLIGKMDIEPALPHLTGFLALFATWLGWILWSVFFGCRGFFRRLGLAASVLAAGILFFVVFEFEFTGDVEIKNFRLRRWGNRDLTAVTSETNAEVQTVGRFDFPGFLGPNRDGIINGVSLASDWQTTPPKRLWKLEVGEGWSGVCIVNGWLYTMEQRGANECVTCYRLDDGELIWLHETPVGTTTCRRWAKLDRAAHRPIPMARSTHKARRGR
ncbi:MAG: hypothetical protein R3C03_12325 [Pirellulaceae bacterium]